MTEREKLVYVAKLAEQSERYDEMTTLMTTVCASGSELSTEERNMLSVAYKNAVGARRATWRIATGEEKKLRARGSTEFLGYALEYRNQIVRELDQYCGTVLGLLTDKLIASAPSAESKVFYIKMEGDYERYKAEYSEGAPREEAAQRASAAYSRALDLAKEELAVTNPIRLGLALNYSVFEYEVLADPPGAIALARESFQDAISELDSVPEETYKDSTLIMQLLRDNLTLWTSDETDQEP